MSDAPRLPQTDWDRVAAAAYVAFWEAANMDVEGWSQLCETSRERWRVTVKHALQTWLHCDFRAAVTDQNVVRELGAILAVSQDKKPSERLMQIASHVPIALIDPRVFDGTSAEIFPPMEDVS